MSPLKLKHPRPLVSQHTGIALIVKIKIKRIRHTKLKQITVIGKKEEQQFRVMAPVIDPLLLSQPDIHSNNRRSIIGSRLPQRKHKHRNQNNDQSRNR